MLLTLVYNLELFPLPFFFASFFLFQDALLRNLLFSMSGFPTNFSWRCRRIYCNERLLTGDPNADERLQNHLRWLMNSCRNFVFSLGLHNTHHFGSCPDPTRTTAQRFCGAAGLQALSVPHLFFPHTPILSFFFSPPEATPLLGVEDVELSLLQLQRRRTLLLH